MMVIWDLLQVHIHLNHVLFTSFLSNKASVESDIYEINIKLIMQWFITQ